MARHPRRKIVDKDLVYASKLLRRVIPSIQENIDLVARKGNGSVAYAKCEHAIRELLELLSIVDDTHADGYTESPSLSPAPRVLNWLSSFQHVDRLGEAVDWYKRIFEAEPAMVSDSRAEFSISNGFFCLLSDRRCILEAGAQYSVFAVMDLPSVVSRLAWAGAKILYIDRMDDKENGDKIVCVVDPFGNKVAFIGAGDLKAAGVLEKQSP